MTSLLTYFTSNDVVILSITPILLYVGKKAEIRDMVPFLTAQFIAANTLSMGLYIGSPTNIVLGDALGLDFYSYFVQMLLPSVVSTIVTLGILYLLFAGFRFLGHSLPARYNQMNEEDIPKISFEMLFKAAIFFICLVTLSLAERWHLKLWIISLSYALLLLTLDLIFYGKHWRIERTDSYQKWRDSLIFRGRGHIIGHLHDRMPYTIVPFVFGFFFFVQAMSSFGVTDKIAGTIFEHYSQKGLISTTLFYGYISAFIVNIMNDIPATVFLSEVLKSVHFESNTFKQASILATAVGVNVGCYITYIGALAGIMWFKLIENQKKRGMITAVTPTKKEFFLIGIIVAPLVILSACMAIIFQVSK
jgi:arsenical pump membrane protein